MLKNKKVVIVPIVVLVVFLLLLLINFIPTFKLKSSDMSILEGGWINVYYQNEKSAAEDVFHFADLNTQLIAEIFGFDNKEDISVYIYDSQSSMQTKKYGFFVPLLGLDWYIGDNIGTDVILTSPANSGSVHSYDRVRTAVLHEIVHAYLSVYNPEVSLWLDEGMAIYLVTARNLNKEYIEKVTIPTYNDIQSENPIHFANIGGYMYANTYIEYIEKTYGWETVINLLKTENYQDCFNKTEKEIYDEWVMYLSNYHQ